VSAAHPLRHRVQACRSLRSTGTALSGLPKHRRYAESSTKRGTAPAAPAGLVACIGAAWTARGCANECRSSQPRCKTAAGPPAGARAEALPKRTRLFPAARGCQSLLVDTRTHTVAHNQHCTKQAHHLCLCAAADTATLCRVCWGCAVGSLQALCSQMQSTIADKVSRALDDV